MQRGRKAAVTGILGGALLVLASLGVTGAATAKSSASFKVTLVTPFTSYSPDWSAVNTCFKKAVTALGGQATVVGPNQLDLPTMINDIQAAADQGTQGVATWVGDPQEYAPAFAALAKSHVPLVTIQSDSATLGQRIGEVTDDLSGLSKEAAQEIIRKTNGHAKVGIIASGPQDQNQQKEIADFKAALKASPGSSVVTVQYDKSDASLAATEASAMISAQPTMNVLWTTEGAAAPAMAAAVKQAHAVGKVLIVGVNVWPQTQQFIKNGTMWATFSQHFCYQGTAAGTMLMDHLLGKPFPKPAHSVLKPNNVVVFPVTFITKATLATAGGD
jgi:ABC-type sugar transport system substrate-binding protein